MNKKINIVITAGGTVENIDDVRSIANTSTGKLGSLLCREIINYMTSHNINDYKVHYILSKTAIRLELSEKEKKYIAFYEVTDTLSVKAKVEQVLDNDTINYFIHSMAISDFMPTKAMTIKSLAKDIEGEIEKHGFKNIEEIVEKAIRQPSNPMDQGKKMPSKEDLILLLERTPKIIAIIKEKNPDLFLVGFKLLNNVSEEELISVANRLSVANKCDLVLANDLKTIMEGEHKGLLIKKEEIVARLSGKEAIAKGIIIEMFSQ